MTPEEIVLKLKEIAQLNNQIADLQSMRVADEKAIAERYNVAACNAERNASAIGYTNQINDIQMEIRAIQSIIEANLGV